MKQKKITIKPFLNKNLAALSEKSNGQQGLLAEKQYPLYYQVTFNRKNTQIKSYFGKYYTSMAEAEKKEPGMLQLESEVLRRSVAFEYKKQGHTFTLVGLKEKYETYIQPVEAMFEQYLRKKLMRIYTLSHSPFQPIVRFDGFEVHFALLMKASRLLIPEFKNYLNAEFKAEIEAYETYSTVFSAKLWAYKYATVMDWVDGTHKIELKNKLIEQKADRKPDAEKTASILSAMVEERIKFL